MGISPCPFVYVPIDNPQARYKVWRGCVHKRDRVVRLLYDSQDFYMGPFTSVCAMVYSDRCTTGLYFTTVPGWTLPGFIRID